MRFFSLGKFILKPGPILVLTLIGILLLSAVIYYRAIKIQRFLEPALAISEPRLKFNQTIKEILAKEFGTREPRGIKFKWGSIFVEQSLLLLHTTHPVKGSEPLVLRKLSRVFLSVLKDPATRNNISLILICMKYPAGPDTTLNKELRFQIQEKAVLILNALFVAEPELEKNYRLYLAATALPVNAAQGEPSVLEFRLVPAERLHIEILERLEKYSY